MTCKDCVYSPICKLYADFGVTDVPYDENDICKLFRSKIDLVEVVRCKDCKHFCPYEGEEHKGDCAELVGLESCVYEDDYCSYGERLEADGDKNG